MPYDYVPITGYNTLTNRLLHYPAFMKKYLETLTAILDKDFTVDIQDKIISRLFQELTPYIKLDPFIKLNENILEKEKDLILTYINDRNQYLTKNLNKLK
jgi:spore coat protein H